jgi:hypothetical protein
MAQGSDDCGGGVKILINLKWNFLIKNI